MNILAIGAHPDDFEFSCGGFIVKTKRTKKNTIVIGLVMTSSTVYDSYTNQLTRDSIISNNEIKNAAKALKLDDCVIGPFQDTNVPFNKESVGFIEKVIKKNNINTIFTHWSGDSHQDHINTYKSALAAARFVDNFILYEQVPAPRVSSEWLPINLYIALSEEDISAKLKACSMHKSQIDKFKESQGLDMLENIKSLAKYRGAQINNAKYAEGFHILKTVNLNILT